MNVFVVITVSALLLSTPGVSSSTHTHLQGHYSDTMFVVSSSVVVEIVVLG